MGVENEESKLPLPGLVVFGMNLTDLVNLSADFCQKALKEPELSSVMVIRWKGLFVFQIDS